MGSHLAPKVKVQANHGLTWTFFVAGIGFEPMTSGSGVSGADLWEWLTFGDAEVDGWVEAPASFRFDGKQIQHQISATFVAGTPRCLVDLAFSDRPAQSNR